MCPFFTVCVIKHRNRLLREVVESASLDIFKTAPDDAALRGDIGFCQRPFTASCIVGFSDSISICELASKSKVQIKLSKRLTESVNGVLPFPLLKSKELTIKDF